MIEGEEELVLIGLNVRNPLKKHKK